MTTPQDKASAAEVLRKARARLGENGELWFGGEIDPDDEGNRCCAGMAIATAGFPAGLQTEALRIFGEAIGTPRWVIEIGYWNDSPSRTFPEVREAFLRAIELAEQESPTPSPSQQGKTE